MPNAPELKIALVGVSRDCFPIDLTRRRLAALAAACQRLSLETVALSQIIESSSDAVAALAEAEGLGCNAAVIYLGNFGPEGPLSIFAERFPGPVMACGAAEESGKDLIGGRGDAFCGMLNAGINFALRHAAVHIPHNPVGLPATLAETIAHFRDVARVLVGAAGLKIFAFGPRPQDFYACNAPIGPLYDMGVEIMENSELDMLQAYNDVSDRDEAVRATVADMTDELGAGNTYPDLLVKLARFEVALTRFAQANLGSRQYAVFANKCWPAFEKAFGFVPCYVNSRLSARGMPVACEVDIYGAFSEYLCYLAGQVPATLLDINNTVPADMLGGADLAGAAAGDLFMGFHCGNTPSCCMKTFAIKHQLIMKRLMEPEAPQPDITRGTLEGQLMPGPTTVFRVQGTADGALRSYIAQGRILDLDPQSFGAIGVIAIPGFARFYRHVLIGRNYPHHAAVAFAHVGAVLHDAVEMLGVPEIAAPRPAGVLYDGENPFLS
ncbi:MAG: fucose isomerase [Planctomycetes bacterium]|nr:fucose isomerase [Planctomycetota bacterium]